MPRLRLSRATLIVAAMLTALMAVSASLQIRAADQTHSRLSADDKAYIRLAKDLRYRHHWGDLEMRQPYRWSPGTPVVFAAVSEVTGAPVDRDTAQRVQAVVGTLTVPVVFALGLLLAGPIAGLVAAAGVAVYLPLIHASATAGTETLGALLIATAALALIVAIRRRRPLVFAGVGLLLGGATLVRSDLLAAALLLPIGIAVAVTGDRRSRLLAGAATLLGVLALIGPWSLYASRHAHHFVPVADGGPANLFVGTYLPADGTMFGVKHAFAAQTRRVHPDVRNLPTSQLPQELVLDAVAARYPRLSRDAALRKAAMDNLRRYAIGRPLAFTGMELRKFWRMWGNPYTGSTRRAGMPEVWQHRMFVLLALLGFLAGAVVTRDRRFLLLALLVGVTTLVDVVFVSEPRHATRLIPVLLAGGAAGWWAVGAGRRRGMPARPGGDQRATTTENSA